MKWVSSDVDKYSQSKEYVDTAIVPLIPISLDSNFKSTVAKGEFIHFVSTELERQLKGRVFLFPEFSYLKNDNQVINKLEEWKNEIQKEFKYIIFLTSDESIKEKKSDMIADHVMWLPTVPFEHMDEQLKRKLLQDQVEQILNILLQSWNK
ncbi:hypothetical protein JOC75_002413 [Metabacillus crassostreae]|uniref:YpiF family protein n=1 Tax=Metabacillus crassostreae TaxID=929098 RepID=UPI0019584D06|nr:YpiF family protein [Metabacillus crassostreae]MBM7604410.1 hypothetical protein [Metabacillus crassostreae]